MCMKGEGNGAFVVAELCGAVMGEGGDLEELRREVKGWFGEGVLTKIESGKAKGRKVLLEKVAVL